MLAACWAVLIDLWHFVLGKEPGAAVREPGLSRPEEANDAPPRKVEPKEKQLLIDSVRSPNGSIAYVMVDSADCLKRPVIAFDNKLGVLQYGDTVSVDRVDGAYAFVRCGFGEGWVRADALVEDSGKVFPTLEPGRLYSARHEDTFKIRRWLKDELLAGRLELPLQPAEYVMYQMSLKHHRIDWPQERPRRAGSWHRILRGNRGVRIEIEPRTNSIMEYVADDGRGVLACVSAVSPEQIITVKSIGRFVDGECRLDTLSEKQWRELRPVFISIR